MPPDRHIPASAQAKGRQRSQRACGPCRKRKIKCDGKEPCEACSSYGYQCVFIDQVPRTQAASETVSATETIAGTTYTTDPGPAMLEPKVTTPYCSSECIVTDGQGGYLLHQSIKTRFTSAASAVAYPRLLGVALGMSNPPRLQAFGWNPARRLEPKVMPQIDICNIISLEEMKRVSTIYFNEVHPFFSMFDRQLFEKRAADFWISQRRGTDFEAVICTVVALGSYFAGPAPCPAESEIVEHGKQLLDLSTAYSPALLSVNHVVAWVLRSIYLRCTTRPHISWIASCTAIHIAESIGLHRDINKSQLNGDVPRLLPPSETEYRRKTFWVATGINAFFSSEYGRTRADIELPTCHTLLPKSEDLTTQMISILHSVPQKQNFTGDGSELQDQLKATMSLPVNSPFLGLLRADACFCIFRLLRTKRIGLPTPHITSLLEVIRVALDGVKFLISMEHPWWNILGIPFHSACILLFTGTTESISLIPKTLETLKSVAAAYDSPLSREALLTAQTLVQQVRNKRNGELGDLDQGLQLLEPYSEAPVSEPISQGPTFELSMDNDPNLSEILNFSSYYGLENDGFLQLQ